VHVQDPLILYPEELATWNDYGLTQFGGPVLVESNTAPYLGSHEFTTDLTPQDGTNYHGATVVDSATPLEPDGTPVYLPVWQFMMVGPPELPRLQLDLANSKQIQIGFSTFTNYNYQVQTSSNLFSNWNDAGPIAVGNGAQTDFTFPLTGGSQFFRIAVQY
jgi:hypothetical protein